MCIRLMDKTQNCMHKLLFLSTFSSTEIILPCIKCVQVAYPRFILQGELHFKAAACSAVCEDVTVFMWLSSLYPSCVERHVVQVLKQGCDEDARLDISRNRRAQLHAGF